MSLLPRSKICSICLDSKTLESFGVHPTHKQGRRSVCNSCRPKTRSNESYQSRKDYHKKYRKKNIDKYRDIQLKRYYGLSLIEFRKLSQIQNNACAICLKPAHLLTKLLCVDHDHTTGKIRGLLCTQCNQALGLFKDNPSYLNNAMNYLTGRKGCVIE